MVDPNQDPNQKSAGEDTLMEKNRKEAGANVEPQADEWASSQSSGAAEDEDRE